MRVVMLIWPRLLPLLEQRTKNIMIQIDFKECILHLILPLCFLLKVNGSSDLLFW